MEISYCRTLVCIHVHVCECVNVCMSMWVTHHYPAPWASSSDAHLSALLLHTEPSEPSAVYTLPLLLLTLSLFISLTHSHAHLFSLRLSYFLSPSPSSSLQYISHSHALSLSCVLRLFSHELSSISLYNCTSTLCIYLCRSRLIQTQTVSAFIRFRQTLRVRLC